ncbi:hypothetical protein [Actinobaculum sp. 313]|uniref:hypothetical protein n=1 Tax=Actinobaculum sp. 313 TaxID=2495645 RepID=UPI000F746CCD|nr:hypothetical protein [Actinobaculum sp. 313]
MSPLPIADKSEEPVVSVAQYPDIADMSQTNGQFTVVPDGGTDPRGVKILDHNGTVLLTRTPEDSTRAIVKVLFYDNFVLLVENQAIDYDGGSGLEDSASRFYLADLSTGAVTSVDPPRASSGPGSPVWSILHTDARSRWPTAPTIVNNASSNWSGQDQVSQPTSCSASGTHSPSSRYSAQKE